MRQNKNILVWISVFMTLLAGLLSLIARKPWSLCAALAMAVSTAGDCVLAGWPSFLKALQNRLIKGGAVFFLAHCLYIAALVIASGKDGRVLPEDLCIPLICFAALTVLHAALFYRRAAGSTPRIRQAAAFFYLLTVGLHAALALTVCLCVNGRMVPNAVGAALFFLSDAVVLARGFGGAHIPHSTAIIWGTYIAAQLCLMTGFFIA